VRRLAALAALIILACSGCATALTGSAGPIATDGATVSGMVISNAGGAVEYWAEFGPTTAYGSETAHQSVDVTQNALVAVEAEITGLQRATTYHFRFCARDGAQQGGAGCGEDRAFTTQPAGCGDTVTTDIKLTGDLDCPQEPGFIVGADGIDINLGGHTIDGEIFVGGGGPRGIDNSGGFDDVTVRNGELRSFGFGVWVQDADGNRIVNLGASAAGDAITIHGGQGNEVRHSGVFGRHEGLVASGSDGLVVADTSADSAFGSALDVTGNLVRLVRNHVPSSTNPSQARSGIQLAGNDSRVADNVVGGGWTIGGISVSGSRNAIVGNEVSGAALPLLGLSTPAIGDGIFVSAFTANAVLRDNFAHDNEGDGIEVDTGSARVGDNRADDNGDFGIDAEAGVTDLGGNTASGNGNPLQCRNVFCAPSP
jgi:parallel beta helix pectate lyase-like protein